jgi:hypothetical protein
MHVSRQVKHRNIKPNSKTYKEGMMPNRRVPPSRDGCDNNNTSSVRDNFVEGATSKNTYTANIKDAKNFDNGKPGQISKTAKEFKQCRHRLNAMNGCGEMGSSGALPNTNLPALTIVNFVIIAVGS